MCLFSNFKTCVCKDAFGRSHEINLVWKYLLLKYVYNDYIQKKHIPRYTKLRWAIVWVACYASSHDVLQLMGKPA